MDRNWRSDPFWRDLYPRWAEPIFKEGIDIRTNIVNDATRFAVEIDAYQFRPEEIQVCLIFQEKFRIFLIMRPVIFKL